MGDCWGIGYFNYGLLVGEEVDGEVGGGFGFVLGYVWMLCCVCFRVVDGLGVCRVMWYFWFCC